MRKTRNDKKVNSYNEIKALQEVEKLFTSLSKDKTLPTFGEHYMQCLMFDIVENVNLKKMYPKLFLKLSKWLKDHERAIIVAKK